MSNARVAIAAAPESFAVDGIHRLEDVAAFMLLDEEGTWPNGDMEYLRGIEANRVHTVVQDGKGQAAEIPRSAGPSSV